MSMDLCKSFATGDEMAARRWSNALHSPVVSLGLRRATLSAPPPAHPSCVWGAKLGIAERERRRTEETIVSFPFPRVMDGQFPPAAAASQPKTEPNRIACSRSVHGNWIIVFQRLPPPTWIDGLTSRILPNPTRRIMKRASERETEDLCPSVRPSVRVRPSI